MNISNQDIGVLKELAEKIVNIASLSIHGKKIKMWKEVNGLKSKDPWFGLITFHSMKWNWR